MKKILGIIAFMLALCGMKAQSYQLFDHHYMGGYSTDLRNLTEMRNGQVTATVLLSNFYPGLSPVHTGYGICHLKVSVDEAQVIDSIVVGQNYFKSPNLLFEPNPHGEDYVSARVMHDNDGDQLIIGRYDDALLPVADDIMVTLEEEVGFHTYFCIANDGIIMAYPSYEANGTVFLRYGLDGIRKAKMIYGDLECPINSFSEGRVKQWNDAGTEYLMSGTGLGKFAYWILDSTFNIIDSTTFKLYEGQGSLQFLDSQDNDVVDVDEETYIVATHYTSFHEGLVLSKRSKATHENINKVYFQKEGNNSQQWIIGLNRSRDDNYYFVFRETYTNYKVVKFDEDLNIIWDRVYYIPDNYGSLCHMQTLSGGLVIGGTQFGFFNDKIFVLIVNDEGINCTPEAETFIRPYAYWPNPAQDQLHLQYSPDVKPMQVELYDLQGRLVRSQNKDLENLSLQGLSVGTYTMRVMLEDGKVFSDKVVKE